MAAKIIRKKKMMVTSPHHPTLLGGPKRGWEELSLQHGFLSIVTTSTGLGVSRLSP